MRVVFGALAMCLSVAGQFVPYVNSRVTSGVGGLNRGMLPIGGNFLPYANRAGANFLPYTNRAGANFLPYGNLARTVAVGAGTCANSCGSKNNPGNCWCDTKCVASGDCCADYQATCVGAAPVRVVSAPIRRAPVRQEVIRQAPVRVTPAPAPKPAPVVIAPTPAPTPAKEFTCKDFGTCDIGFASTFWSTVATDGDDRLFDGGDKEKVLKLASITGGAAHAIADPNSPVVFFATLDQGSDKELLDGFNDKIMIELMLSGGSTRSKYANLNNPYGPFGFGGR